MAYKNQKEEKETIKKLRDGTVCSIPCFNCSAGVIRSNPDIPIENQVAFYCDKCHIRILFS